jgi:hypothetical protein
MARLRLDSLGSCGTALLTMVICLRLDSFLKLLAPERRNLLHTGLRPCFYHHSAPDYYNRLCVLLDRMVGVWS